MSATEDIAEAEIVPESNTPSGELVPHTAGTLFRSDDPEQVIERATKVADVLKGVLAKQQLTKRIQGRDHVLVEGWTTCGAMLGVVPVVEWTRQTENGWEARVEARTLDGRVIGAAEASCTRDERTWKDRDEYALRSMAQTRATSKALRGPLGFIVTLAGFEATPSEEMPEQEHRVQQPQFGRPYDRDLIGKAVGAACVALARTGDEDETDERATQLGRALYRLITKECDGYMPQAAALALIHAADTDNLVPDVAAPDPAGA